MGRGLRSQGEKLFCGTRLAFHAHMPDGRDDGVPTSFVLRYIYIYDTVHDISPAPERVWHEPHGIRYRVDIHEGVFPELKKAVSVYS